MKGAAWAALLLFSACPRSVPQERPEDLAGFKARLISGPALRLSVPGEVEGKPAEVVLDLASPLTRVAKGCFDSAPASEGVVWVPRAEGKKEALAQVLLRRARLGQLRLGDRPAGLLEEEARCLLVLGSDVLLPYAIQVDPALRELALTRSLARAEYLGMVEAAKAQPPDDELRLFELWRDPRTDWPLLAVRLRQGVEMLTGPFILSTAEAESTLSAAAAAEVDFKPGLELFAGLGFPELEQLHPSIPLDGYGLDSLELGPGFGFSRAVLRRHSGWQNPGALGILGADVWGSFHATLDPRAGVLLLRRPRVLSSGGRQLCGGGGHPSEERCFSLHTFPEPAGVGAVVAVFRDLPEGGRVYLEPRGADGQPLRSECRFGVSFAESDRGANSAHRFPWTGLSRAFPSCARELAKAKQLTLALFEEGAMAECPGTCAFAQHLASERASCECQPRLGQSGARELRLHQLFRRLMEKRRQEREREPADPECILTPHGSDIMMQER